MAMAGRIPMAAAAATADTTDRLFEWRFGMETHWQWRLRKARELAAALDPGRFGVRALYVIGSTKNVAAGPESDIDLVVHFAGSGEQRAELLAWFRDWDQRLVAENEARTGRRCDTILDLHLVSDEDVARRAGFAVRIGAVDDPAWPLPLGET
jgi:predicted nucleotidyltransferase